MFGDFNFRLDTNQLVQVSLNQSINQSINTNRNGVWL